VMPAFQARMIATARATLARIAGGMVSDMGYLLTRHACQTSPRHPLHQWGIKPTVSGGRLPSAAMSFNLLI
jgi:hypothetical protein